MNSTHSNWYLDAHNFINSVWTTQNTSNAARAEWYGGPIVLELPQFTLFNDYVELAGDSFGIIPFFIIGTLVAGTFINWFVLNSDYNVFLTSLFSFSEKEINALDDLLVAVLLIFLFFFFNFLGCFAFVFSCTYSLGFSTLFLALCFALISIPVAMVYNFGFYFIISIRGGATTLSYVYELILDYVNLTSFALRLIIQLVRIVVIGVTYYMYNHLFLVYNYLVGGPLGGVMRGAFELVDVIILWSRLVFEVGHTFILFGIQFLAFNIMILWLFQFLFTLFFADVLERSFLKRSKV